MRVAAPLSVRLLGPFGPGRGRFLRRRLRDRSGVDAVLTRSQKPVRAKCNALYGGRGFTSSLRHETVRGRATFTHDFLFAVCADHQAPSKT